jgi:hypothetical protein
MLVKEFLLKNPGQLNPRKTLYSMKKKESSGMIGSQKVTCTG